VEHLAFALDIFSLSLGLVGVLLSLFAYARLHSLAFRHLAVTFTAGILILTVTFLKSYDAVAIIDFGSGMTVVYAALSAVGYGLFAYMVPTIAFPVCSVRPSGRRVLIHAAVAVVAAALGAAHELVPGALSEGLATSVLVGIQLYAVAFVARRLAGIAEKYLATLLWRLCVVVVVCCAAALLQFTLRFLVPTRTFLLGFPLAPTLYFVLAVLALVAFAMRYSLARGAEGAVTVPESFVLQYGISRREKEIIELILGGYNNRMIAESLFISAMTVKNHIYHIYQKTGAENKIQLLNLMKTGK
jgi:DNA-binding CsgD family transcriptional regulator